VGSIGTWKELKRLRNDGHSSKEVCLSVMCFHYAPWIRSRYATDTLDTAADTQLIRLIPQLIRIHPLDVFALDTQPTRLLPQLIRIHPFDAVALDTQPIRLMPI
jgi:hypothetical protein